jgi:hypothetical protein
VAAACVAAVQGLQLARWTEDSAPVRWGGVVLFAGALGLSLALALRTDGLLQRRLCVWLWPDMRPYIAGLELKERECERSLQEARDRRF